MIWTAPGPFWEGFAIDSSTAAQALGQPEILRFASDSFMEELFTILAHDPHALRNLAVRHETWRGPESHVTGIEPTLFQERKPRFSLMLGRMRSVKARRAGGKIAPVSRGKQSVDYALKLYQPAHQRYYLVCGCLVCARFGFPDRSVDPGKQERVSFFLRRLLPADQTKLDPRKDLPTYDPAHQEEWEEYAFVPGEAGAEWRKIPAGRSAPIEGEERLPLFPLSYCTGEGRMRRLFAGLIPVGRREAYMGAQPVAAPMDSGENKTDILDPRMVLLQSQVLAPWKALVDRVGPVVDAQPLKDHPEWVFAQKDDNGIDQSNPDPDALKSARAQIQTASWYILLDLANFLRTHLKDVWAAIAQGAAEPADPDKKALLDALKSVSLSQNVVNALGAYPSYPPSTVVAKLTDALKLVVPWEDELDKVTRPLDFAATSIDELWPDFLFLLADPWYGAVLSNLTPPADPNDTPAQALQRKIDALGDLFDKALDPISEENVASPTAAAFRGLDMREGWFVIRCVYERPECGPLQDTVVGSPTRAFQLAAFFDPDAPARPVRIGLPVDTTPAGLRKFDKNAVFMISDILCGQISRMKGITFGDLVRQVLPWPLHKDLSLPEKGPCKQSDGLSLGMMCSLSIPIVTLCALILLMIMVNLLDFIFRWLPWFIVCFPLPGFKGKKA